MKSKSNQVDIAKIEAYRSRFLKHVHLLVWQSYCRLDRSELHSLHEPAITGLICEQIEQILDDVDSPAWVDDYDIHDDPPVHDAIRKGKDRRRVDLKLVSRRYRPRLRFCFEAKCLNKSAGVADYLGEDGLGQFISGGYASEEPNAGMLAYVQTDDNDSWCIKIGKKIEKKKHRLARSGDWTSVLIAKEITHTYQTTHIRIKAKGEIVVHHTILDCQPTVSR